MAKHEIIGWQKKNTNTNSECFQLNVEVKTKEWRKRDTHCWTINHLLKFFLFLFIYPHELNYLLEFFFFLFSPTLMNYTIEIPGVTSSV